LDPVKGFLEPSSLCYFFLKLGKSCFSKGQEDLYVALGFGDTLLITFTQE